jgi:nucleoside-diphosphate-sugar epimerase
VYDEAKRFAESLTMAMHRTYGLSVGIARIFNTYGPRLSPGDGRVVSNFVVQALRGEPLTVYGDGTQTRSFCFVEDEVAGLLALLGSSLTGPVNIGNPDERTMLELARLVLEMTGSQSEIVFRPLPTDDPTRRCPDIGLARQELGWSPRVSLRQGLEQTIAFFAERVGAQ